MARGIQEGDVWAAADALLLEGQRPTIERVRLKVGRGSPNTVSPFLETWFKHLGGRIADPGAFSAPPDIPDPVLKAAKHFWEAALALTRGDFDERLREGLASAVANVEAEKEKAAQANAAAFEAVAKASRLQGELEEHVQRLDASQQALAAERARLEEVRGSLTSAHERLRATEARSAAELAELRLQLEAAVQRADAADRRVALELERERTGRAKAERREESLQKTVEGLREASGAATEQARRQLDAARDREEALKAQLAAAAAELALERQRLVELRAAGEASAADAVAARDQVASLQGSLDRLTVLVEAGARRTSPPARKRVGKSPPPASSA
jgi:chromosome segregation ATPase